MAVLAALSTWRVYSSMVIRPAAQFDESLYGFAVRYRAGEHAVDDGVAHDLLVFGAQAAVVQLLGQFCCQGAGFAVGGFAIHPLSV